jgi:hypothetical protein
MISGRLIRQLGWSGDQAYTAPGSLESFMQAFLITPLTISIRMYDDNPDAGVLLLVEADKTYDVAITRQEVERLQVQIALELAKAPRRE